MNFVTVSDKKQKQNKSKTKADSKNKQNKKNNKQKLPTAKCVPASVSDCHPNSHTFTKYFSLS